MMLTLMRAHTFTGALFAAVLVVLAQPAGAEWNPRTNIELQHREERTTSTAEVFWPRRLGPVSTWFGDVRLRSDNETTEFNAGLGARRFLSLGNGFNYVVGGYGYYDRLMTAHDNAFNQATIGGEILGEDIRLRSNAYLNSNEAKATGPKSIAGLSYSGNNILVDRAQPVEQQMDGYDVEFGYNLAGPIWALAKQRSFDARRVDKVIDRRLRLQVEQPINDAIRGGKLVFGMQHHRGVTTDRSESGAFIRLSLPFGENSFSVSDDGNSPVDRMLKRPERDIDVVTTSATRREQDPGINPETGEPYNVTVAQKHQTGSGEGTFESPATLQEAVNKAPDDSMILVKSRDGSTALERQIQASGGIVVDKEIHMTGSNRSVIVKDPNSSQTLVGNLPGDAPSGEQTSIAIASGNGLTFASGSDGSTIKSITIAGNNALTIDGADNVQVTDVIADGLTANALTVKNTTGTTIDNSVTRGPLRADGTGSVEVTNWSGQTSTAPGAAYPNAALRAPGYDGQLTIKDSTLSGEVQASNLTGAADFQTTTLNNDVTFDGQDGTITFDHSSIDGAVQGVNMGGTAEFKTTALNNNATFDGQSGTVQFDGSTVDGTVSDVNSSGTLAFDNSTITDQSRRGLDMTDHSGTVQITNSTIEGGVMAENAGADITISSSSLAHSDPSVHAVNLNGSSSTYQLTGSAVNGSHLFSGSTSTTISGSTLQSSGSSDPTITFTDSSDDISLTNSTNVTVNAATTPPSSASIIGGSNISGSLTIDNSTVGDGSTDITALDLTDLQNSLTVTNSSVINGEIAINQNSVAQPSGAVTINGSSSLTANPSASAALNVDGHAGAITVENTGTITGAGSITKHTGNVTVRNTTSTFSDLTAAVENTGVAPQVIIEENGTSTGPMSSLDVQTTDSACLDLDGSNYVSTSISLTQSGSAPDLAGDPENNNNGTYSYTENGGTFNSVPDDSCGTP